MEMTDITDRLTEREKQALRGWLEHKTAKEIAIELGITHHAVEKRLKMARVKLDAGSSLEAARMLAEAEGYEPAVAGPSELALEPTIRPLSSGSSLGMINKWSLGAMITFSAAIAVVFFGTQSASQVDPETLSAALEHSLEDEMAAASTMFDTMDRDKSGTLEESEFVTPISDILAQVAQSQEKIVIVPEGETRGKVIDSEGLSLVPRDNSFIERRRAMFALLDRDGDGAVSREEFSSGRIEGIGPRSFNIELAREGD